MLAAFHQITKEIQQRLDAPAPTGMSLREAAVWGSRLHIALDIIEGRTEVSALTFTVTHHDIEQEEIAK